MNPPTTVSGEVSGVWCGEVTVDGQVTVPVGQTLTVCAGSHVIVQGGANSAIRIAGTLDLEGTAEAPILIDGQAWAGLQVGGTLTGAHVQIRGAEVGLSGLRESVLRVGHLDVRECGTTLSIGNGGDFTYLTAVGGSSIRISGGALNLTDSLVDLQRPENGPDCLVYARGGGRIEHSRVTGCHCPMHINQADLPVEVVDSVLDGASYPVMIANAQAQYHRNHFGGTASDFDDIGGNIQADISDNYYGGGPPDISTANAGQFTGADVYRAEPIPGVGPR